MAAAGGGSIINVASIKAFGGSPGTGHYGAAKAGIMGMTFVWSMELGRYGVTVNAVAPAASDVLDPAPS